MSPFLGESSLQCVDLEGQGIVRIGAYDFEGAHAETLALFDGDGDVDSLAVAFSGDQGNAEARMRGINVFENGFADGNLEVTIVSIETSNADFEILAQLLTVAR